jgi:serine/threonine protein phosphatase 1
MPGRTFAIGDIHGDAASLAVLLSRLPPLDRDDTLVFLGDYVDRGPASADVVELVRALPRKTPANVVALRGNHEDAWLRVIDEGWPHFVIPQGNGCLAAYLSFTGQKEGAVPFETSMRAMLTGSFFPPDVVAWMRELPFWHEDDHAIYVHAGLPGERDAWPHPSDVADPVKLLWLRDRTFFEGYRGKRVVFGHTVTECLPAELSAYTPEDPADLWAGVDVIGIDTGCGKGGFLTAVELPALRVYESR